MPYVGFKRSQCIAGYWPRCRCSPAYCVTAVSFKLEVQNRGCESSQALCDQDSCKRSGPRGLCNPVFLDSTFGCRYLTLDLTTNSTTTPVTPESLEGASLLPRGLYAISTATPCVMHIFRFSRFSFCSSPCPFKRYTLRPGT